MLKKMSFFLAICSIGISSFSHAEAPDAGSLTITLTNSMTGTEPVVDIPVTYVEDDPEAGAAEVDAAENYVQSMSNATQQANREFETQYQSSPGILKSIKCAAIFNACNVVCFHYLLPPPGQPQVAGKCAAKCLVEYQACLNVSP